jgi:hypothetical protein
MFIASSQSIDGQAIRQLLNKINDYENRTT